MKLNLALIVGAIVLIGFASCKKSQQNSMLKNSTGNAGELVVVINPNFKVAESGKLLDSLLSQHQMGLPQPEPLFDVIHIPHEAFGDIFKTTRNLIITKVNSAIEQPGVTFQRDVYANSQAVVYIDAKDQAQFYELIKTNIDKIIGYFLKVERDRIIYSYSNFNEKAVSVKTEKHFGFTLSIPPGYNVAEASDSFMWIRYETPEISQAILVYSFPYESDSTFTQNYLLAQRNKVLKKNVPGPRDGSYMTTETEYPLLFNTLKNNGNYTAEMRGLWRVENDFMGGPFVNVAMLDLYKKRVVVLDGYVYAPNKENRNYLRQVEGIIYSLKFDKQSEMDKLNKQFD